MRRKWGSRVAGALAIAAAVAFLPPAAHADAGVTMLPVEYPQLLLYIVPVILIEAFYLHGSLRTPLRRVLIAATGVNLITVALGYPLAWGLYRFLNSLLGLPAGQVNVVTHFWWVPIWITAKVMPGWTGLHQSIWPVLVIYVCLLIPGYIMSALVKAGLLTFYDMLKAKENPRPAIWAANRASYVFLAVVGCVLLYRGYLHP